ncbi:MAG: hypothetical protein HYT46_01540 [Candidatus Vogelbacteria bacterium]|nr:hypothetical protein [Candidatus Vogelbacteria bacterium]
MTTEQTEQTELRPFHETVVEAIARVNSYDELNSIANLIKATKIPKGHDEIVMAWDQRLQGMGCGKHEDRGVPANLLAQKQAAEKAADDLRQSFHFGGKERVLMIVIEKIIGLIQNWRQPSPQARDKVTETCKLFETAKKIYSSKNERDFKIAIADLK